MSVGLDVVGVLSDISAILPSQSLTLLKSHLFKYQGHVSAALVLGGVDVTVRSSRHAEHRSLRAVVERCN